MHDMADPAHIVIKLYPYRSVSTQLQLFLTPQVVGAVPVQHADVHELSDVDCVFAH